MKITAKQILAESDQAEKNYRMRMIDPLQFANRERTDKLAIIEDNAVAFAEEFLGEFDLPSNPIIRAGNLRGFEGTNDFSNASGSITMLAEFHTLSGHKIRLELPVPIFRGEFFTPSVMKVHSKLMVFSVDLLEEIIENAETVHPRMMGTEFEVDKKFIMEETINQGLFATPVNDDDLRLGLNKL